MTNEEFYHLRISAGARIVRGIVMGFAAYALVKLQPFYDFNSFLFGSAAFALSMLSYMQRAMNVVLLFLLFAVFVPERVVTKVASSITALLLPQLS